jgi:Flp pilus assembly pilin Flp
MFLPNVYTVRKPRSLKTPTIQLIASIAEAQRLFGIEAYMRLQSLPRRPNAAFPTIYQHTNNPPCCICNKPVPLETPKTEEHGSAIHEDCYLLKLNLQHATSDGSSWVRTSSVSGFKWKSPHTSIYLQKKRERSMALMKALQKLWFEDTGQDIAEYAVMLAVILVIVVGTIRLVGSNSNNAFSSVASSLQWSWGPGTCMPPSREQMTNPITNLDAYTDEELKQALARVLALARGEGLNDAEVQKFWQLYEEILRRRAPSGTAA